MLTTTRRRIDGHWARRLGAPVPGLVPVTVCATGRHDAAALALLLGDHAWLDAPLDALGVLAPLAWAQPPAGVVDPGVWAAVRAPGAPGPVDHFWADHGTDLPVTALPLAPAACEELREQVTPADWEAAGFDRAAQACFGIREEGRLVAASVLGGLWGWPIDVGVLVASRERGRGLGRRVAAAALAAGVRESGFAAFRTDRRRGAARAVARALGLAAHGTSLVIPLAR